MHEPEGKKEIVEKSSRVVEHALTNCALPTATLLLVTSIDLPVR
jgi:hypothetical protein